MKSFSQRFGAKAAASLGMALSIMIAGCSDHKVRRIAVSQCSDDDWRAKMNQEILYEAMLHDVEVEIVSADDSSEKQIADIKRLVDKGIDILIVAPNEAEALTPTISELYNSGVPVILFDRHINGDSYTAFQGADNAAIGRLAAQMARHLGGNGAKVLEIRGLEGSTPAADRHAGFAEGAARLGLEVVGAADGNWNAGPSAEVADSLLRLHPEADIIYAHNDRMAIAAAAVADSLGLYNIKVIGVDAAPQIGIRAVADSVIDATFLYPTEGGQLIRTALAILEGKPYDRRLILPSPSSVDPNNAELLLLQADALSRETAKITALKSQLDDFGRQKSLQQLMLYAAAVIVALLTALIFLLVRAYWANRRHHALMEQRNADLARQKEELADLYEKLSRATSSKLNFFTNVSHDLRTPLTLIASPVADLAAAPNLTPEQHVQMQLAEKNVKRLMRLVNQILDIRKHDNSHLALKPVDADLGRAVQEWCTAFKGAAVRRHIALECLIDARADLTTAFDIEKMERVVFNLISNSLKFTPENGHISVGVSRSGSNIVLRVEDSGCGISADDINSIFERFFTTETINPNGSGIGLALTKIFVEMHGGTIEVESTPGRGSLFTVTLPVHLCGIATEEPRSKASEAVQELLPVEPPQGDLPDPDAPTLLVIDDNADIRTLVKSILGSRFTILEAANGSDGIRLASKYLPDLVICDVMMPGIDGFETCRKLKSEPLTSHIPVLMLTACSRDDQRTLSYGAGADAYMSKPFGSDMLIARCDNLLANRRRLEGAAGKPSSAAERRDASAAAANGIDDEFYARFVEAVENRIADSDLSVEDIADRLGLSRVQMYRKIKSLTNYSPAELLRNIRLDRAATLIKTSEQTVAEIAYAVGFTAPNHFTKCYKQRFGELPSETRKRTSGMGR